MSFLWVSSPIRTRRRHRLRRSWSRSEQKPTAPCHLHPARAFSDVALRAYLLSAILRTRFRLGKRSFRLSPPGGESLKDTLARTLPYFVQEILPCVLRGERTLVAAHGNSLRALMMVLEKLTPEGILKRELATGVPIIYRLNADATVASKPISLGERKR